MVWCWLWHGSVGQQPRQHHHQPGLRGHQRCGVLPCGVLLLQSYYGAALCVCWSPDAALLASGGEDDLVTVYSIADRQVSNAMKGVCLLLLCAC
jgi:WD40 repeat protein